LARVAGTVFSGDVGGNGRLTVAADPLAGPEPQKDVLRLIVLPCRNPERRDKWRFDYGNSGIINHKRSSFYGILSFSQGQLPSQSSITETFSVLQPVS
jgi:hypothetical protein